MKAYRPGVSKTKGLLRHVKAGASQSRDTGKRNDRYMEIDKENDRYVERITTPDGDVIKDVSEPLSTHRGHGSAKTNHRTT